MRVGLEKSWGVCALVLRMGVGWFWVGDEVVDLGRLQGFDGNGVHHGNGRVAPLWTNPFIKVNQPCRLTHSLQSTEYQSQYVNKNIVTSEIFRIKL